MVETILQQVAALCWRRSKGKTEVLLITSRETRRWIIPKGWPMDGLQDYNAARREAFEEAGVEGHVRKDPVGSFGYDKRGKAVNQSVKVTVYALEVVTRHKNWPEKGERQRQWFTPQEAAVRVAEPGLKDLLRNFSGTP